MGSSFLFINIAIPGFVSATPSLYNPRQLGMRGCWFISFHLLLPPRVGMKVPLLDKKKPNLNKIIDWIAI